MPSTLLLVIIYIAFISLGLPDSVLGVAWPTMRSHLGANLEAAGLIAILLTACSATSSFLSVRIMKRFGTGPVVFISTFLTVVGLFGYASAPSYFWVVMAAIPMGFGQGAIDSTLNSYVAGNYSSLHMNWLHASWGIGATLGPLIMTGMLAKDYGWRSGYIVIGILQSLLTLSLFFTLKLWHKAPSHGSGITREESDKTPIQGLRKLEPWLQIFMYALYTASECSVGIWTASMLIESRHMSAPQAGLWVSLYYAGITVGRLLTGMIADRVGNRLMVRLGLGLAFVGAILLFIPGFAYCALAGLLLLGLGFSPIYPCLMHETPRRFDHGTYERVIAYQIGAASIGASVIPASVGVLASATTLEILAPSIAFFVLILFMMNARLDRTT